MTGSGVVSVPLLLIQATAVAWGLFELVRLYAEWRRTAFAGEAFSTLVVMLGVVAALWLDGVFSRARLLILPGPRDVHLSIGLAVLWLGLLLRAWAHAALRSLYTTTVTIQPGHRLVRSGPYARVRHPSYGGLCLALLGFALAGGSIAALLTTAVVLALVFAYRIPVEERALRAAFGADYDAYVGETWRLLPGVY